MGANHVEVGERAECAPENGARLDRLNPEVEREKHAEDGDAFVIVAARHRARDVAGYHGNEGCR